MATVHDVWTADHQTPWYSHFCKTASTIFGKSCWMDKDQNGLVEAAHLTISGLDPHKIPHLSNLGRLRSRISLVAKNEYLDAKYNDISS